MDDLDEPSVKTDAAETDAAETNAAETDAAETDAVETDIKSKLESEIVEPSAETAEADIKPVKLKKYNSFKLPRRIRRL